MDSSAADIFAGGVKEHYRSTNARLKFPDVNGDFDFDADRRAVRAYFLDHVNQNTVFFHNLEERLAYLIEEGYYEEELINSYPLAFLERLWNKAFEARFRFPTLMGAYKFFRSYALKTRDGKRYLERYEDRVCMVAIGLARGDQAMAEALMQEMITGRFQPATPTFNNMGKKSRGELVSCFLLRTEDNMESIARNVNNALQLSKRGGGVAINLTNLREAGAPIKGIENQSAGVLPVMKLLEDSFSYANQLGARPGAGAAYLNVHHPDLIRFLDCKRENADEKIRIKTLSLGLVITDVFMQAAARNQPVYQFSPYDVERVYGVPMTDISITEKYDEMVADERIRKSKVDAREVLTTVAAIQAESGYPYMVFEDTVNAANPIDGRVTMSNLCTEILQVSSLSTFLDNLDYNEVGHDISCNLASLNISRIMDGGDLVKPVNCAIRALTAVSEMSMIDAVPSVRKGNDAMHAVGLGQMNLHGFLSREGIAYASPEAVEFTSCYFAAMTYATITASNEIAQERGRAFAGFEKSTYADGSFFQKYVTRDWLPTLPAVKALFEKFGIALPTRADWSDLAERVIEHGIFNAYLQAIAPTGSISYINHATSAIHPAESIIEPRKEGQTGLMYVPAPHLTNENKDLYSNAFDIGPKAIIDVYAAATQHIDQGAAMTLFFPRRLPDGAGGMRDLTTRDISKAQIYAYKKGLKTIYYMRVRDDKMDGMDDAVVCEACSI